MCPATTANRSWWKKSPSTLATGWMSLMPPSSGASFRPSGAAAMGTAASTRLTPGSRETASMAEAE